MRSKLLCLKGERGKDTDYRVCVCVYRDMWKQEGTRSFYKGITPRIMRVAPGQAVTFTVYEYLKGVLEKSREMMPGGRYEE